jgi:hypothetical protein
MYGRQRRRISGKVGTTSDQKEKLREPEVGVFLMPLHHASGYG